MTGRVADIWRHPIKSHGREAMQSVDLEAGKTMPWDRTWAVQQVKSELDVTEWVACSNFSRVAQVAALQAIETVLDEKTGTVTLTHPDRGTLSFRPDQDQQSFLDWVQPLMPADHSGSKKIVRLKERGLTDSEFPSISLNSHSSNSALSDILGSNLSPKRWRGNIWFAGFEPWEEFNWIGKKVRIGTVELHVKERIGRCLATTANPVTGQRDASTLAALKKNWGHTDFGVYGEVITDGHIALGDTVEVIG